MTSRRAFLTRSGLALGTLLVGDEVLEALDRLTHRKVFALGGTPLVMPFDVAYVVPLDGTAMNAEAYHITKRVRELYRDALARKHGMESKQWRPHERPFDIHALRITERQQFRAGFTPTARVIESRVVGSVTLWDTGL